MTQTLIALDAGTTGVTALLFDSELEPIARSYREFEQHFPEPGRVEHEAAAILEAADTCLAEILAHPRAGDATALGITNQRETIFAVERKSGRAIGRGIVWQDRRTKERCDELAREGKAELVKRKTGLIIDPYFSATKIEWMLRADEDLARRAAAGEVVFCTVDALLVGHLTANALVATDLTNASRTMLFDIDERRWSPELCSLFGLDSAWLPEVRPSSGSFGTSAPARTAGRAIPILGVAGDQQSALFGQGGFDAGSFKATYGTGCFLLLNSGQRRVDSEGGLLTTLAVGRDGSPCFAVEGSVFIAGAVVQWLRDQLGFFREAGEIEALARSVPDSAGVAFVPAFAGLGAPYWDSGARGAILGLTRGSSRAHIARAALEAIAFQNAELVELLRAESGLAIDSVLVDGGAAQNDFLMQLQADLAGLRVVRPADVEATARGAAALAGLALGLWRDPGMAGCHRSQRQSFDPELEESQRAERMASWRAAVQRVRSR